MIHALVGFAMVLSIAVLTGVPLFAGLRRGVIYSQRVAYSRADDPRSFWFYAAGYGVGFLSLAGLFAYFLIDALVGP